MRGERRREEERRGIKWIREKERSKDGALGRGCAGEKESMKVLIDKSGLGISKR